MDLGLYAVRNKGFIGRGRSDKEVAVRRKCIFKYRSEIQIRNTRNTIKNLDTNAVRNKGFIGRGSSDKEGAVRRTVRLRLKDHCHCNIHYR